MITNQGFEISDIVYNLVYSKQKPYIESLEQLKQDIDILNNKTFAAELFTKQINEQIESKGKGKLKDLIYTKNTWEVS